MEEIQDDWLFGRVMSMAVKTAECQEWRSFSIISRRTNVPYRKKEKIKIWRKKKKRDYNESESYGF